jgi:hypothetical protein
MIAHSEASLVSAKFEWPLEGLLRDLRVRYGIKMALAGMLGLFAALVLRLEHPNWSVLTVVVMMNSQHVGAISIKVILRVVGTIIGATLGVWLIGSYDTSPVIVLTGIFVVVGLATYKFGQYPASQVPYAYFLVGLTLLSVATYGVPSPNLLWQTGLNRALENMVGAFSALAVTTLVWPRYAREEFFEAGRSALETAGKLLSLETDAYIHQLEGPAGVDEIRARFTSQLAAVRNLLQVGARESTGFRARIANYNAFVVSLTDLFQSAADLERRHQSELAILERVRDEIEALNGAIAEEFAILARPRFGHELLPPSRLKERLAALEAKIVLLRSGPEKLLLSLPLEVGGAFLAHYGAIRRVCDDLETIRDAMAGLPRHGESLPEHKVRWDHPPTIDWFWVKNGIKGGLATVIGIILVQSYNPPGPASIPLAAWSLTIFQPSILALRWVRGPESISTCVLDVALFCPGCHFSSAGRAFLGGLRRYERRFGCDLVCVGFFHRQTGRRSVLVTNGDIGCQRFGWAQCSSTGGIDHDHRIVPGARNRDVDCRPCWKSYLAGPPARGV